MADFVISKVPSKKVSSNGLGYHGKNNTIIHNGAAPVFLSVPGGAKRLEAGDDLILVSSAMATDKIKRQDLIAAISLVPGVKIIHSGVWPDVWTRARSSCEVFFPMTKWLDFYERGHYFLHPAVRDVCPNSLIEGLCAGLPVIYNSGPGSGGELGGKFGISLNENDLPCTVAQAREGYVQLATALADHATTIRLTARPPNYMCVFQTAVEEISQNHLLLL